ncbi:PfkB family carbohydrate kinase [Brevibacterium daeguense]|uniref:PfkB family carbohydrate kinase n=1 Tax=Brevibacterium daeguense TaxID=909936 RepID=A0ABP8EJJ9_9MICO|nr:PfkB family carbohydrate kinase [Brevibacterium daeguense]
MPRVIHSGQALVDLVVQVPALPASGRNVNAEAHFHCPGGALNILTAAARAGARTVHAGAVGDGPNGDLLRSLAAAEGIELANPPVTDADTAVCVVLVEPDGQRTFVTTYGAERMITCASLGAAGAEAGDIVCITGYTLFEPTREPLLQYLASLPEGVRVVLDPGEPFADFDAGLRGAVLSRVGVFTSNAAEAEALTGIADPAESAGAVARLLPTGGVVVVRDGAAGCYLHAEGSTVAVPGFPQEAVDTNGAGDAHTGVLLAERTLGTDWTTAARRANAAAAIKVTRRGPATAAARGEVDAFLAAAEQHG